MTDLDYGVFDGDNHYYEALDLMGEARVVFGSDWPHIEALAEPLDYLSELRKLDGAAVRKVMRDNAMALTEPSRR